MSQRPIPYFEKDGSYNEYVPKKRKPPAPRFTLDWTKPLPAQVADRVSAFDYPIIDGIDRAMRVLEAQGILPGNRVFAARRQVELKVEAMIRRFAKRDDTP